MMHSWKAVVATAVLSAMAFGAGGARESAASPVTYNFAGTVDFVTGGLAGQFALGNTLSGSFTFESTTPALGGSTATTAIFNALSALNFALNGYTASTTGAPELQIGNNELPDGASEFVDRFFALARATDGLTGASVNGFALSSFILLALDETGSVFSSALNLPTSVSLADFNNTFFSLRFDGVQQQAIGHLTAFAVEAVPEPATLAILGLGLLGLGAAARRRKPIA